MEIKKEVVGQEIVVSVKGRVDASSAPELESETKDLVGKYSKIVLNLKETEYISSAGLRVVLSIQKSLIGTNSTFVIKSASSEVMEVFDMTGFSNFLTFEDLTIK